MQSQLTIFESYLIDAEKDICQPLKQLSIKQNNEITCCIRDGIISLEFNDTENIYCPFSIVFTRDKTFSFFSFYIGYGAEIACHELIGNADDYLLSRDIDFFYTQKFAQSYILIDKKRSSKRLISLIFYCKKKQEHYILLEQDMCCLGKNIFIKP